MTKYRDKGSTLTNLNLILEMVENHWTFLRKKKEGIVTGKVKEVF